MWNLIGKVAEELSRFLSSRRGLVVCYGLFIRRKHKYRTVRIYCSRTIAKKSIAVLRTGDLVEFEGEIDCSPDGRKTYLVATNFSVIEKNPKGEPMATPIKKIPETEAEILDLAFRARPSIQGRRFYGETAEMAESSEGIIPDED